MPALHYHQLDKRTDSGTVFSIIFGVVAASVVVVCAIWAVVIPHWRKTHPPNPSRTKWNDGSILTRRSTRRIRTFPTHPAIKPLLSKPSAAQVLPTYNPRTESPFPDAPERGQSRTLPSVAYSSHSAPAAPLSISSNGLFTPVRDSSVAGDKSKARYYTVPRVHDAKHFAGESTDFGDAKEFILAIPEPLTLRPREAGRPPAVTRHLERYGAPNDTSPACSDKLPHPNKLFRAIDEGRIRSSLCSSTSLRVDHRESDAAALAARQVADAVDKAIEEEIGGRQRYPYSSDEDSRGHSGASCNNELANHNGSSMALHRLRSYRSLTGSRALPLGRTGTLTRPKTPVDELRRFYGRDQTSVTTSTLPQMLTSSSLLTTFENGSEIESVSTPATSPTLPPSISKLLPTPLRPYKSLEKMPCVELNTLAPSGQSCITLTEEAGTAPPLLQPPSSHLHVRTGSRGFVHAGRRIKPAPLDLAVTTKFHSAQDNEPRRSLSGVSNLNGTVIDKPNQLRSRVRASSMYSRDTHGYSLASTPATPDFSNLMIDVFSDQSTSGNPFRGHESVKARINEWTQRIEGLPAPPLPRPKEVSSDCSTPKAEFELVDTEADVENTVQAAETIPLESRRSPTAKPHSKFANAPGGAIWI